MRFTETHVSGAFIVESEDKADERGSFMRLWCRDEFARHGLNGDFVQCNTALSHRRGTLRGLHYQIAPHDEVKLIRCMRGGIFDVLVDLRPTSTSYLRWFGTELNARSRSMLYVPAGCAHGYLTLQDDTEVIYPASAAYEPAAERGVRWDDPLLRIEWPLRPTTVSPKDQSWPDYAP
jgi:dTDP-4-dehydrorhamnose 3,5-epimerase